MKQESFRDILKMAGLKASKARLDVLKQLSQQACALTAHDLHRQLARARYDFSTVYRNLGILVAHGLVQKVHVGDGTARFELSTAKSEHHHHHLICRRCQKIEILDRCFLPKKLSGKIFKGFQSLSHRLELDGICPACQ